MILSPVDGEVRIMSEAQVALITGGARGIGRAIACELAASGYCIAMNYNKSESQAMALTEELTSKTHVKAIRADVTDRRAVSGMAEIIMQEFGRLDVLINNAGATVAGNWRALEESQWQMAIDANLTGTFNCIQTFAPLLSDTGRGRIINIGSTYANIATAAIAAYSAAKAGVESLTRVFAKELAPNVLVNAIAPGNINTEMTREAGQEFITQTIQHTPLARLGEPAEIAKIAAFLLSESASFITGQIIVVDGGHSLR